MATFKKGILGGFNGKVGTVIGYRRYGKDIMRSIASHVRDRKSDTQLMNRMRFKETIRLSKAFAKATKVGLELSALNNQRTTGNDFFSLNWEYVTLNSEGVLAVDYSKLRLSEGSMTAPAFGTPKMDGDLLVEVTFPSDTDADDADADDEVYIFVYQAEVGSGVLSSAVVRSSGKVSVTVPAAWSGTEVHVYGFAVGGGKRNNGQHSGTAYLGKGTIE